MNDEYYENIIVALKAKILSGGQRQQSFERTLKEFEQQMLDDCNYTTSKIDKAMELLQSNGYYVQSMELQMEDWSNE